MTGQQHFERRNQTEEEPWRYGARAAELLRHDWIVRTVGELASRRLLDIGCSLGQLTTRLASVSNELYAADISLTAVARARTLVAKRDVRFAAASAVRLPFAARAFDLVLACDGLYSWDLDAGERQASIDEIRRVVQVGGQVLFTEHARAERFEPFIDEIAAGGLHVVSVCYLYDRPWYQFESWLKLVRGWQPTKHLLQSRVVARALRALGHFAGSKGSRHVCVLAVRER